jgi:ankyrin repeat protein
LWEHQRQILQDFEKLAAPLKSNNESSAAAFQAAMCYMVGFGTCRDLSSAAKFLSTAEELDHVAARLFGPHIRSTISSEPPPSYSYTSQVVRGLEIHPPKMALTLSFRKVQPSDIHVLPDYEASLEDSHERSSSSDSESELRSIMTPAEDLSPSVKRISASSFESEPDFIGTPAEDASSLLETSSASDSESELKLIATPLEDTAVSIVFQTYEDLKRWLFSAGEPIHSSRLETAVLASSSLRMSVLECAILFRDLETVDFLLKEYPDIKYQRHLRDPLLITACCTTNAHLVEKLLRSGLNPTSIDRDGNTIFHWLFMLGDNVQSILPLLLHAIGTNYSFLDTRCTEIKMINPQWPLRLTGTPLSFAVSAGSMAGVEALLHLGANPTSFIHEPLESDNGGIHWTPVHLAIKNHSPSMFLLLIKGVEAHIYGHPLTLIRKPSSAELSISAEDGGLKSGIETVFRHLLNTSKSPDTWKSAIGCAISFSSSVERISLNGSQHEGYLAKLIKLLPRFCFSVPSIKGCVALMQAIDFHDVSVVTALLTAYPDLADTPFRDPSDQRFIYPIHFASQMASHRDSDDALDIVKILLGQRMENTNLRDSVGRTPLHFAVNGTSNCVTKWLIENGGLIDATSSDTCRTPLHGVQMTSSMDLLLEAGANINQQDIHGCTLSHIVALAGREHLMTALIDHKANLHFKDDKGRTLLHCAVIKRSFPVLAMLLKTGLDVNAKTLDGNTPLHLAVQSLRSDIFRLLIEYGADISEMNNLNFTPLHQCTYAGDEICLIPLLDVIKLRNPSLMDARAVGQQTALHVAATLARRSVASRLLLYGADPGAIDEDGNTPLHLAIEAPGNIIERSQGDRVDFCALMCKHLSTQAPELVQIKNKDGSTPWDMAFEKNKLILVEIIFQYGGFEACSRFMYREKYVGSSLVDKAIEADAWDLVILLLSHQETLEQYTRLSNVAARRLQTALRMSDKISIRAILEDSLEECQDRYDRSKFINIRLWNFRDDR